MRNPPKSVEVLAHVSLGDEEMHVAWHFPGTAPVNVSVGLDRARKWTETLLAQGRRSRGAPGTRNLAPVGPGGDTDPEQKLLKVGEGIYAAIFTQAVEERWNQTFIEMGDDVVIHIVVQWDSTLREKGLDPALIPFETLRRPGEGAGRLKRITTDFALAKNVSIERRITDSRGGGPVVPRRRRRLNVLVFTAPIDFEDADRKEEDEEGRGIANTLGNAIETETLISSPETRATWGAFCKAVQGRDIVHFIGHGKIEKGVGYLLFETDDGKKDWVPMSRVATALRSAGAWLLVLNCCETVSFSSFACEFPAVIGHQFVVAGHAVEAFEQAFFRKLVETRDIEQAVWAGRQAIWGTGPDTRWEYRTPVLYLQARKKRSPARMIVAAALIAALVFAAVGWGWWQLRVRDPLAVELHWFGQREAGTGAWEALDVGDDAVMSTGDQFKLALAPSTSCYAALFVANADGTVVRLIPQGLRENGVRCKGGRTVVWPPGDDWFTLKESPGLERLYVVASMEPLRDLMKTFGSAVNGRIEPSVFESELELLTAWTRNWDNEEIVKTPSGLRVRNVEIQPSKRKAAVSLNDGRVCEAALSTVPGRGVVVHKLTLNHRGTN